MMKTCQTCDYHDSYTGACSNASSEACCADFTNNEDSCKEWADMYPVDDLRRIRAFLVKNYEENLPEIAAVDEAIKSIGDRRKLEYALELMADELSRFKPETTDELIDRFKHEAGLEVPS